MKKWLLLGAALSAVLIFGRNPSAGMDVGMLQPVQVVLVKRVGDNVVVQTDTLDQGVGEDFVTAVRDMKASASGEIFLETAEHLLVAPEYMDALEEVYTLLRPSCTVCLIDGEPDFDNLGDYLKIHVPSVTLMNYRAGDRELQTLITEEGRMTLVP